MPEGTVRPARERLFRALARVYGERGADLAREVLALAEIQEKRPGPLDRLDLGPGEGLLIAYGDQVQRKGEPGLRTLGRFLARLPGGFGVHVLPLHPYSSDDGFSVIDYYAVRPELGSWEDVRALARGRRLMLDAVVNHASRESVWFKRFLRGEAGFEHFFLEDEGWDTSRVVRPRTTPLFAEIAGRRLWTTFGPDQVDLNYREPRVFLEVLKVLYFFVRQGADLIRLDAVGFLWKAPGRPSIHEPETHALIQAFRAALDLVAPGVKLVTETNVPHAENVAYFGDGFDEAQLVYNFALPPLVLDAYARGDARRLSEWAAGLQAPSPRTAFLNFLASHDGIGLRPAEGLIPEEDLLRLLARARAHGGGVSYRSTPEGERPYELNLTWWDALNPPGEDEDAGLARHLGSHLILLALAGLPAVYFLSWLGAPSWREGYEKSGVKRRLNRQKFEEGALLAALRDPRHRFARVFSAMKRLFSGVRAHPLAPHRVLEADPRVFAVERDGYRFFVNVSAEPAPLPGGGTLPPYQSAVHPPH